MSDGEIRTVNLAVDFFENHKIRQLAEEPDGGKKILVWLKLLTYAGKLNDEGRIYETKGETLNRGFLSSLCGITEEQVGEFLKVFKRLRMIRFDPDNTMRLVNWQKYQKPPKNFLNGKEESVSPTPLLKEEKEKCAKQTDISLSYRENIELLNSKINNERESVKAIIDYLNGKCSTHFKYNTPNTVKHIRARLLEGFTVNDFKKVIDSKYDEWKGTRLEQFLKPDTLFSTKFEGYLQYAEKGGGATESSFDEDEAIKFATERKW